MKTEIRKSLTRAAVARLISFLKVDPWRNLSSVTSGVFINAWTSGRNARVDRISIDASLQKADKQWAWKMAKKWFSELGLTVHYHGAGGTIILDPRPGMSCKLTRSSKFNSSRLP